MNKVVSIGDKVIVLIKNGASVNEYASQICYVVNDKLFLDIPTLDGKLVKPPVNGVYEMKIYTGNKGIISSKFKVSGYKQVDEKPVMLIEPLSDMNKVQRREFFRLDCTLPIKFSVVNIEQKTQKTDDIKLYAGIVKDIGAGGIKFISNKLLPAGSIIQCVIVLNKQYLLSTAKILDYIELKDSKFKYQYRVIFTAIDENDKDKIIQYIFDAHRRMLSKGFAKVLEKENS